MAKIFKIKDNQTGQIIDVPEEKLQEYGLTAPSQVTQPTFQGGQPAIQPATNGQGTDALIQKYFPQDQWGNAKAIMMAESGGNPSIPSSFNKQGTEDSWGLFQINLQAHPQMRDKVLDPEENVKYAAKLYKQSGWSPWYNSAKKLGLLGGGATIASAGPQGVTASAEFGTQPTFQNGQPAIDSTQPNTITGRTLKEHSDALNRAKVAGDTNAIKQITDDYNREYKYQEDLKSGKFKTEEEINKEKLNLDKQKAIELKDKMMGEIKTKAQAVKDIIELGKQGKLTGEQYNTALGQAASDFNKQALFAKEDKVAGSALTAIELAQLGGGIIGISSKTQNILDRALGYNPAPQPKVEDKQDIISQKMDYVITGKPPVGKEKQGDNNFLGGLATNAGKDLYDLVNGALNIPKAAGDAIAERVKNGQPIDPGSLGIAGTITVVKGLVDEYNNLLGKPLEGGDILKRVGERAYEKPITTLLDILPFVAGSKLSQAGKSGKLVQATEDVAGGGGGFFPKFGKNIKGRAATSVGVIDAESVVRSEKLMSEALQQTKSFTRRGMAQELEQFIPKANEALDNWVKVNDAKIGLQPLDEIKASIKQKLLSTTSGQANPQLVEEVISRLDKQLNVGQLPGGMEKGNVFGTNLEKMNQTRKSLNASIPDKWFQEKPAVSNTDNLSHLNWAASEEIKNIMSDLDTNGIAKQLLHQQYVAYQAKPILSKMALTVKSNSSPWTAAYNALKEAINIPGEPLQIGISRLLQGKEKIPITPQNLPGTSFNPSAVNPSEIKGIIRKPLPPEVINPIMNKVEQIKPAQSSRLIRDMRYKQGNWQSRAMQERVLRSVKKIKYK